ncbi:MAG TPA: hypothetical protein VGL82_21460 [Bryobacteraceae bacterium]
MNIEDIARWTQNQQENHYNGYKKESSTQEGSEEGSEKEVAAGPSGQALFISEESACLNKIPPLKPQSFAQYKNPIIVFES